MSNRIYNFCKITLGILTIIGLISVSSSFAESAAEIDGKVDIALKSLYKQTPAAKELASVAKGVLVFPDIVKGGLIIGGQYGNGALRIGGKTMGYYNKENVK